MITDAQRISNLMNYVCPSCGCTGYHKLPCVMYDFICNHGHEYNAMETLESMFGAERVSIMKSLGILHFYLQSTNGNKEEHNENLHASNER